MNKVIVTIIIIAVVVAGGYFLFSGTYQETSMPADDQSVSQSPTDRVIIYTDAGYSSSPLEINIGDTVVFKNESSLAMWPASAMHPTHKDYPTTGGCLGSTFDACKGVQPGDSWSFKFDIAGDWKYHDHLSPKNFGAIIVQ